MASSRRYVKRIWRVPKDRGALEYCATLLCKLMVKHGWPVDWHRDPFTDGFVIHEKERPGDPLPADIQMQLEIATRILARTYRLDLTCGQGWVGFNRRYEVTRGGFFKEV